MYFITYDWFKQVIDVGARNTKLMQFQNAFNIQLKIVELTLIMLLMHSWVILITCLAMSLILFTEHAGEQHTQWRAEMQQ